MFQKRVCLETSAGETVKISRSRAGYRIVVEHRQKNEHNVTVDEQRAGDGSIHMAFCFETGGKKYYPFVGRDSEQFLRVVSNQQAPTEDKFFFKWVESTGDLGRLKSVAYPDKYITVSDHFLAIDSNPRAELLFKLCYQ